MSEHIDSHHHQHGTPDEGQGSHGLIPPPPDDELAQFEPGRRHGADTPRDRGDVTPKPPTPPETSQDTTLFLHHWGTGPSPAIPVTSPYSVRLRDGSYQRIEWRMPWYLDRVKGTTTSHAVTRLYDVFLDPKGWVRAGVHWVRVWNKADARILIRVIPAAETVCGPGAAGCYSFGFDGSGKPVAENGVEYIDRDGPWQAITGMEAQGHGTFKAWDLYINHPEFGAVPTVMGTWKSMAAAGYRPTANDLESARIWLRKETPVANIHPHH